MLWLCLMMIVPTLASADMVSISELRQQAEAVGRWTQTYEAHGRTIEVDVPIIVPEVEAMPIVTVEAYNAVEIRGKRAFQLSKQCGKYGGNNQYSRPCGTK